MKNSFVMYTDWMEMIKAMDNESRGELLLAIMEYQTDQDPEDMSITASVAFACMKTQFDKDEKKYNESAKKRSEAGKIAAQARANADNRNESQRIATNRNESQHDNDNVNDLKESTLKGTKEKQFKPPTVEDVKEYCDKQSYSIDAERFVDFYASKGWMVGKNKMKDWRAAVRNWAKTDKDKTNQSNAPNSKPKFTDFSQRQYDYGELNKKLFGG